ncbi:MAG: 6-phosphogluconate dehydrogenase [Bacteroidetes bacterium]|nr:MAG: 6-phosphogluconate dehydrogenase [Bacteroidota bacterium]
MSVQLEKAKQSARKWLRRTIWIAFAGLLVFGAGYYVYRTYTISEGSRTGTLFKISKKGVLFKTYEGQLHLAGSVMMSQQSTWDFSAKDGTVYEALQQFEGKNVKCYYRQKVDAFPWQGDTDYIVYKVERVLNDN